VLLVVTALAAVSVFAAGAAQADQGANVNNGTSSITGAATTNATRVNIYRFQITRPGGSGATIEFVREQHDVCCDTGLVQIGYYRSADSTVDCGNSSDRVQIFVEYGTHNSTLQCDALYDIASPPGTGDRFGLVKQLAGGYWAAYFNGTILGPNHYTGWNLGMPVAGGEWVGTGSKGISDACYGCNGTIHWQFSTDRGSSYTDITSATPVTNGPTIWTIERPPSPFRIHD
jgi:hypothetical protein